MAPRDMRNRLDWQNKRRHKYKSKIINIKYKNNGCDICGYKEHPEILQFHHKKPDNKSFQLSGGNLGNRAWATVEKEMNKCILICPNCHNWLHYQEKDTFFLKKGKNK